MTNFVATLELPEEDKERLACLTPATYTGIAAQLAIKHGRKDEDA